MKRCLVVLLSLVLLGMSLPQPYVSVAAGTKLALISSTPCNKQTDVPIGTELRVTFNLAIKKGSLFSKITVREAKRSALKIVLSIADCDLMIRLGSKMKTNTQYTISIPASALRDINGHQLAKAVTITFTTEGAKSPTPDPAVTAPSLGDSVPSTADPIPVSSPTEYYQQLAKALEQFQTQIVLRITNYNEKDYTLDTITKVLADNPILDYGCAGSSAQIEWIDGKPDRTITINLKYKNPPKVMLAEQAAVEQKATKIIAQIIQPGMSELAKVKVVHDYVINHARYDNGNSGSGEVAVESYTDYGILVQGVGVCEGYAKAMFRLLNQVGIKCLYISGTAQGGPHAWNLVRINGSFYHLDATFDDPIMSDGSDMLQYQYFCISDVQMAQDHTWTRSLYPNCPSTLDEAKS